jgi:flagellar biosynthesis/type III secretory pathway chaperone
MDRQADAALKRAIGMLEAILARETDVHREMLAVAESKQAAIVQGDLEALEKSVTDERRLVVRIEDEERKRLAVMPLVKSGLGADDGVEKLADVIAMMPEPERGRMSEVRDELKVVLEACQLRTRHNAELLKASLEHVDAFLRSLSDATSKDATYKRNGKRSGGGPGLIDRSV